MDFFYVFNFILQFTTHFFIIEPKIFDPLYHRKHPTEWMHLGIAGLLRR